MANSSRVIYPDYQIYSKENIQKTHHEKENNGKNVVVVDLELSSYLKGSFFYERHPFNTTGTTQHIEFFARSDGWDAYTETGYHSHFFQSDKDYTEKELVEQFTALCINSGLNIDNPEPIQTSLF